MHRTASVHELRLRVESLAARAVEAGVDPLVDLPRVVDPLDELLNSLFVAGIGGADEEVVRGVHPRGHLLERGRVAIDELLHVQTGLFCHPRDVRPVLVGAREEEGLVPALAVVAGENVRRDRRVRVPDVGSRVDVVDGRRQVEAHSRQ